MSVPRSGPLSSQSIWARVQGAVSQRANTAAVFAAVRAEAESQGLRTPAGLFKTVNQYRSIAARLRNASEKLMAAGPGQVLTSDMVGITPYSRSLADMSLAPKYHISFQQLVQTETGTNLVWRSDVISGILPVTKGDLLAQLSVTADLLASAYQQQNLGVTNIQIAMI